MAMTLSGLFGAGWRKSARAEDLAAEGVRLCAEYLAGLDTSDRKPAPGHMGVAAAVGSLVAVHTPGTPRTFGTAAAASTQASAGFFDALLRAGNRALEAGGPDELGLALALADTATAIRERSKGAWRLRGLALEALGRDEEAIEAYERHLALQESAEGGHEITLRLGALREMRACLDEAVRLLPADSPLREARKQSAAQGRTQTQAWPRNTTQALSEAQSRGRTQAAFTESVQSRLAERGTGDALVRRLVELYATYRRLAAQGRTADPLLGGSEPLSVAAFRNLIAGRTVCLVASAQAVARSTPGAEFDSYDLVVRCGSLSTAHAQGTAGRTDVHAVSLCGQSPWEGPRWSQPVRTRLLFASSPSADDWRRALRRRLVPGAQQYVGDPSLRRPVSDPALMGEGGWDGGTTAAFTMLRLLDFLDVSPCIDLIGLGLPGQLRPEERKWVMAHARTADGTGMRVALR